MTDTPREARETLTRETLTRETLTRETLTRETWITGVGIVSCLGEGPQAHWQRLNEPPPTPDMKAFAPYIVHALAPI